MCCFIRLNPAEHMPVTSVQQSYHLYRLDVKWQCGGRSRWEYSQDSRCLLLPWMFGNKWEPKVLESTHPLRDATLFRIIQNIIDIAKIHASLAECDKIFPIRPVNNGLLKSTHPLRDATIAPAAIWVFPVLKSTHPLRDVTNCFFAGGGCYEC